MQRSICLGLAVVAAMSCLLANRVWSEPPVVEPPETYTAVYNVRDLPVWRVVADAKPVFDASVLIEHIKSSVGPNEWDDSVLGKAIRPFAAKQSLVISQTQENHDQIAKVVKYLRVMQEIQGARDRAKAEQNAQATP